jgi:serine O-acetyltransferase
MRTRDLILVDLARTHGRPMPIDTIGRVRLLACAGPTVKGMAVIGFRLSHRTGQRWGAGAALIKQVTQVLTGADIAYGASIGPGLRIPHPSGVVITDKAVIGTRFTIHSCVTVGGQPDGAPVIGDDVSLAPGCRVLGPVRIGDRVRVGANSVLTKTIEGDGVVLAGVPARMLRQVTPSG